MAEKRLIDAGGLWSDIMMLPHNGDIISSEEVEQAIKDAQTVDAVEVVRCKDCKYRADELDCGNYLCNRKMIGMVRPNDFCSFGERKDNET